MAVTRLAALVQEKISQPAERLASKSEFSPPIAVLEADNRVLVGTAALELAITPLHQQIEAFAQQAQSQGCNRLQIIPLFLCRNRTSASAMPPPDCGPLLSSGLTRGVCKTCACLPQEPPGRPHGGTVGHVPPMPAGTMPGPQSSQRIAAMPLRECPSTPAGSAVGCRAPHCFLAAASLISQHGLGAGRRPASRLAGPLASSVSSRFLRCLHTPPALLAGCRPPGVGL